MRVIERKRFIEVGQLNKQELIELLQAKGNLQQQLFQEAREVRKEATSDRVVLRGVVEISNNCQKNCDYCAMRAVNSNLERYRLSAAEILKIARQIKEANIPIFFLQSGQDPRYDSILEEVIPEVKKLNLNVLLCLGERPKETYFKFAELGADSYILKFESSSPELYKNIAHTSLAKRLECLHWLKEAGLKIGTGNIVGLPQQTVENLAEDIMLAWQIQPDFVSSSPFIANQNTPLEDLAQGDLNLTLNTMAIYRIAFPHALIPSVSALEKIQPGGQLMGLNAGANVLTINFSPNKYLQQYAIYSKKRFIVSQQHAFKIIQQANLTVDQLEIDN